MTLDSHSLHSELHHVLALADVPGRESNLEAEVFPAAPPAKSLGDFNRTEGI